MMQFCGNKLDKKDFFGKSDPFLVFYRSNEDGTWVVFLLSPSLRPLPLRFHVCCNPVLHPEEIGFIDSSQIESQAACVDHVRKPAVAAKKKSTPLGLLCVVWVCVLVGVCVCVGSSSCLFSALQCMTSPIRPCTLRAEDTKCTCQPRH